MSIDINFVPSKYLGQWDEVRSYLERPSSDWTDELTDEWSQIVARVKDQFPDVSSTSPRHLFHAKSHVELVGHPGQITLKVTWSSGPVRQVVAVMKGIANIVEGIANVVGYDNQTGDTLLEHDSGSPARMSSASRLFFETRLLANDSVGGSSGVFVLLDRDELKTLRGVKGDRARRAHIQGLLPQLPRERLAVLGQEWAYINMLCGEELPDLAIFVGQRMHKGQGNEITLVKDLPSQLERMAATSVDDLGTALRAIPDQRLWRSLSYLGNGTARMSQEITDATGQAWLESRDAFERAVQADLSALFYVDHYARHKPSPSIGWISDEPSG